MTSVSIKTYAKLNFTLLINEILKNNYHDLDMIMQSVDLYDVVTVTLTTSKNILIECDNPLVPIGENNIVHKCCKAFFSHTGVTFSGVNIVIKKNIPLEAGLAGGSSNGAGVIFALNRIYHTKLSIETMIDIGTKIGTDIPFCLIGGTCLVKGIGDDVEKLPTQLDEHYFVIVKGTAGISTKDAFDSIDELRTRSKTNDNQLMISMIERNNFNEIVNRMHNDFEQVMPEEILNIKSEFSRISDVKAILTGSGSCVFAMFKSELNATKCYKELKKIYPTVFLCKNVNTGIKISK